MANSKYAYVRSYELPDSLLPNTYMVFRLDGHSFHRFSEEHEFEKPNDLRALQLMDCAAREMMGEFGDIVLGFGESDEYSFLLRKSTSLYNRRQQKIVSTLTSYFTSQYLFNWHRFFPDKKLKYPPTFDGRIVLYPGVKEVRDYFAWRQVDTHINNLYNTTFWALVLKGEQSTKEAHETLKGTFSKDKHQILFSQFGINYNTIDERYKKGSIFVRSVIPAEEPGTATAPTGPVLVASLEALSVQQEDPKAGVREGLELSNRELVTDVPGSSVTQPPGSAGAVEVGDSAAGKLDTLEPELSNTLASDEPVLSATSLQSEGEAGQRTALSTDPTGPSSSDQPEHSVTRIGEASLIEEKCEKGNSKSELISTISEASPNPRQDISPLSSEKRRKQNKETRKSKKAAVVVKTRIDLLHCDIIKDEFWDARPEILGD